METPTEVESKTGDGTSRLFNTPQLLQAYERAIDENTISSITDTRGDIVYANRKFCEISKYSESELIGQNHRIVNSGTHPKQFFKDMWRDIGRGNVWRGEIRNRAKDGTYYWVDTVIAPIKDNDVITHYLSLRTLITERKALEKIQSSHLASLEGLLVMTSQKVSIPLSSCLKQIDNLDAGGSPGSGEQAAILATLRSTVMELDKFTKELTTFIRDMDL